MNAAVCVSLAAVLLLYGCLPAAGVAMGDVSVLAIDVLLVLLTGLAVGLDLHFQWRRYAAVSQAMGRPVPRSVMYPAPPPPARDGEAATPCLPAVL